MKRAIPILLVFSVHLSVSAQERAPSARELFEQGVAALDEGRFAAAVELLGRSLELRDSPSARFNRAVALRGAGRYLEAIEETRRYIERATAPRHARTVERAREMLDELRSSVAVLVLDLRGEPDEVRVDGEPLERSETHVELRRDPGEVRLHVSRAGYAPIERTVVLAPGAREELTFDATESPLPASLAVDATPPAATIALDGLVVGRGRVRLSRPPGDYRLDFEAEGYLPERRSVRLAPGAESSLSVTLTRVPEGPLVEQWWFWTVLGGGAAALGAVLAVSIVLANDVPPLELGSLGFSQEVLTWSM